MELNHEERLSRDEMLEVLYFVFIRKNYSDEMINNMDEATILRHYKEFVLSEQI